MTRSPHHASASQGRAPGRPPAGPRASAPRTPGQRQLRVGELLRRTLSEILGRGALHDPGLQDVSITVGEVRVSPDLKVATAFVLPLGGKGGEEVLAALARAKGEIRHLIGREVTLRHVPDLRFRLDETFDQIEATQRLFADERVRRDLDGEPAEGELAVEEPEAERREDGEGSGAL